MKTKTFLVALAATVTLSLLSIPLHATHLIFPDGEPVCEEDQFELASQEQHYKDSLQRAVNELGADLSAIGLHPVYIRDPFDGETTTRCLAVVSVGGDNTITGITYIPLAFLWLPFILTMIYLVLSVVFSVWLVRKMRNCDII